MNRFALNLQQVDQTQLTSVGGKGASLGELGRISGVRVPTGFCVTTDAFRLMMADAYDINEDLRRLSTLKPDDSDAIRELSARIREAIATIPVPAVIIAAIDRELALLGAQTACAVRSSATAEDLPTASFAGQQDTYLNVIGPAAILRHVSLCWASLYTERAVTYRMRNGFDHRKVHMAVIVQQMIFPQAAGVLFTADPLTGHRKVCTVEASFGLGEALVSGLVNADVYKERDGHVIGRTTGSKQLAVNATATGGTQQQIIEADRQAQQALSDAQVLRLAQLGRRIESHFGRPQDIEWCLADDEFHIVQARPITTLFPIPAAADNKNRVYVSVGHQQMMTDAMKPLSISLWQLTAARAMHEAGGRLFVDVTENLASPAGRKILDMIVKSDPLTGNALQGILARGDFIQMVAEVDTAETPATVAPSPVPVDPAIVADLIARNQASVAALKRDIQARSGPELLAFLLADIQEMKRILFDPQSLPVIMAGMDAAWWLNTQLQTWLGEKNAADTLTQSVPDNITSQMGLALLDVADAIRPHADVVGFLQQVDDDHFLDDLPRLAGGSEARDAIRGWLDLYGMRCVGEIDLTRPRWSERPTTLVPLILTNIRNFEPGAGKRLFAQGLHAALNKQQEILERLRALPDGEQKADETRRMIERVRTFAGYREYPKYGMVSRFFVYKQALMHEAQRLVQAQILREVDDIFYLTLQELQEVVSSRSADPQLITARKEAFTTWQTLTPPRVLTSDGEMITGTYDRADLPAGALVGLGVSAGTVEGRARVILDMSAANLEPGDILVTAYTDPSWTPLFVAIKGLVTEVGGLMAHGTVIAREYGLPAVVGVPDATRLIRDGQRIRVHGAEGYVQILT